MKIKSLNIRPTVSIVLLIMVAFFCQIGPAGGAPIVSADIQDGKERSKLRGI